MHRALITGLVALCCALPAAGRQLGATAVPNDPLWRWQVSFRADAGPAQVLRNWARRTVTEVTIADHVGLDAPGAWRITTGSRDVIIAVLDDGFFYNHEDIKENVWRNPGESGTGADGSPRELNGRDDDSNGFVDDVVGWDFAFDDPDPDAYAFDGMDRSRIQPYEHSAPALGIIGAAGNNGTGIAGVCWRVSLMLLRIGAQGTRRAEIDLARIDRAARAIRYAADNGARVINWSGYVNTTEPERLRPLREAVAYAASRNVLLVTGAGNDAKDLDTDANCLYPQCFDFPNQLRVAEVGFDGALVRFVTGGATRGSNFGRRRVELAALGENFSTAVKDGRSAYGLAAGTSNAGPVVAGVAALVLSVRPDLRATELRELLVRSTQPRPQLATRVTSGGVINARRALELARATQVRTETRR